MKKNCFKREKEDDFIKAYNDELKSLGKLAPYLTRDAIILRTIYSGKARYYISFEEAARNVRKVLNHEPINCKNECKIAMYEELCKKIRDYQKRRPYASYREALYNILADSKASRFFFGVQTARLIIYNNQRKSSVA